MRVLTWALLVGALAACTGKEEPPPVEPEDTGPFFTDVTIRFRAEAEGLPFSCHQDMRNLGSSSTSVKMRGMWAYISNLGLVDASGASTLLELESSPFQEGYISLLDFEDGAEYCAGGDEIIHTEITGRVPTGNYTGLAFTLGVPEEENHSEATEGGTGPLHRPTLFTGSLYGHDFLHIDMTSTGESGGYPLYVRSSGCGVDDFGNYAGCSSPNLKTFTLDSFDAATNTVVFDLVELFARNNLDDNATTGGAGAETAPGCQSDPTDPDCQNFFTSYGLTALPPEWIRAE